MLDRGHSIGGGVSRWASMDDHERELRRLRLEARGRLRDVEAAEAELEASTASLTEVLRDWAARGHNVQLDAVDRPRRGRVAHVGDTVVTLVREDGVREVVALRHVESFAPTEVLETTWVECSAGHPHTLVAHLRAMVGGEQLVAVDRRFTGTVQGQLVGVAATHLTLRTAPGGEMVIPLDAVVAVTTT